MCLTLCVLPDPVPIVHLTCLSGKGCYKRHCALKNIFFWEAEAHFPMDTAAWKIECTFLGLYMELTDTIWEVIGVTSTQVPASLTFVYVARRKVQNFYFGKNWLGQDRLLNVGYFFLASKSALRGILFFKYILLSKFSCQWCYHVTQQREIVMTTESTVNCRWKIATCRQRRVVRSLEQMATRGHGYRISLKTEKIMINSGLICIKIVSNMIFPSYFHYRIS